MSQTQTVQINEEFSYSSFFTVSGDRSRSIASHRGLSSLRTLRSSTAPGMSREFLLQEPLETFEKSTDFKWFHPARFVSGWWLGTITPTDYIIFIYIFFSDGLKPPARFCFLFFFLAKVVMKPAATCWVDPPNGDPVLAFSVRQQMQHQNTFENRETCIPIWFFKL